jgi:co-chaperonin GroES (HSP10)
MSNVSGINPVGNRILLLPIEVQQKSASGIILATEETSAREQMANTSGVVVAMGDECYEDYPKPWCAVGDKIVFAKYAGLMYLGRDGKQYRMINDLDVTGCLDADVDIVDIHLATK